MVSDFNGTNINGTNVSTNSEHFLKASALPNIEAKEVTIHGVVKNEFGYPVGDASITFTHPVSSDIFTASTDVNGYHSTSSGRNYQ